MRNCSKCGEYKKVRLERDWGFFPLKVGRFFCQDCDIALKIIEQEKEKIFLEEREKNRQKWIKKRDKILKEHHTDQGTWFRNFERSSKREATY